MITGIDVSVAQGEIIWSRVKEWKGVDGEVVSFAVCKATQGNGYTDPQFRNNWSGIASIGLLRGAYHFADPDTIKTTDPIDEATFFYNTVKKQGFEPGVDFLVLDIEEARKVHAGPEFTNWVLAFIRTLTQLSGAKAWVYCGGPFFDSETGVIDQATLDEFSDYPLWLAAYVATPDRFVPKAWKNKGWILWQCTGDIAPAGKTILHVDGIGGGKVNIDRDVFKGEMWQLRSYIASTRLPIPKPASNPPPPPLTPAPSIPVAVQVPVVVEAPSPPTLPVVAEPAVNPIIAFFKMLIELILKLFGKK